MQAEVLQNWAEAMLAVCRSLPDAELTRDVELQASSAAQPLFRQAVEAYQQVHLQAMKRWQWGPARCCMADTQNFAAQLLYTFRLPAAVVGSVRIVSKQ